MKVEVKQSQLYNAATSWLDKNYSKKQLSVLKHPTMKGIIFYKSKKNGKIAMENHKKDKIFAFDYNEIWKFLQTFLSMTDSEITEVLSFWIRKTFKVKNYKIIVISRPDFFQDTFNTR